MKRLLITGSRNWDDNARFALHFGQAMGWLRVPLDNIVVVHGAARGGADLMAHQICSYMGYNEEQHPARWEEYGNPAGHVRNLEMAETGPDLCLAFIAPCLKERCPQSPGPHGSHGTRGMVFLAGKYGVPTWTFYSDDSLGVSTVPPLGGAQTA